jgi:HEAT repeat protein
MSEDKATIAAALQDPDPAARCRFVECLEDRDLDAQIFQLVVRMAREDSDVQARLFAMRRLEPLWPDVQVIALFRALACDPEIQVADAAAGALARAHDSHAREALLEAYLKAPHFGFKWLVFEALTTHWAFREIESIVLGYFIADSDEVIRASTVSYLAGLKDANLLADLIQLLSDRDARVRANALEALGHFHKVVDRAVFEKMLTDPHHRVQSAAMVILEKVGGIALDGKLERMVKHHDDLVRASAVYVMRQQRDQARHRVHLENLAEDASPAVQRQLRLLSH